MKPIWIGPKVGHPPPTIAELKGLTEGLISELGHTGQRAAALRQRIRPYLCSAAPVSPPICEEDEMREQCQQLSEQLGLQFTDLLSRVGIRND